MELERLNGLWRRVESINLEPGIGLEEAHPREDLLLLNILLMFISNLLITLVADLKISRNLCYSYNTILFFGILDKEYGG
jgi:hypothetical protein